MRNHSRIALALLSAFIFALPSVSSASVLSGGQVSSILALLRAFSVDDATILRVEQALGASVVLAAPSPVAHAPVVGSIYPASSMGYDISFATVNYPSDHFGFGTVGVTRGKSFVHNPRFASEYSWARFASAVAPSLYVNLNAPYGTTATEARLRSPKSCDTLLTSRKSSIATAGGAYPEPTPCASYNYGYNAAKDALAFAKGSGAADAFWWLDIEEENSWSADTAVNDAVIQGALDYLNAEGIRVGIYSMPYMWRNIAGSAFVPAQTVGGNAFTTPLWLPIGISDQISATNACVTKQPFVPGSPIWVIQYVENSTSIDKNIAC